MYSTDILFFLFLSFFAFSFSFMNIYYHNSIHMSIVFFFFLTKIFCNNLTWGIQGFL
nr:MAG TPA: hypothetical protein [Caudoviricetes sp.]